MLLFPSQQIGSRDLQLDNRWRSTLSQQITWTMVLMPVEKTVFPTIVMFFFQVSTRKFFMLSTIDYSSYSIHYNRSSDMAAEKTVERKTSSKTTLLKSYSHWLLLFCSADGIASTFSYLYYQEKGKKSQTRSWKYFWLILANLLRSLLMKFQQSQTVTDKTKLQNKTILKKTENGDHLYSKAQRRFYIVHQPRKSLMWFPSSPKQHLRPFQLLHLTQQKLRHRKGAGDWTAVIRTYLYNGYKHCQA